MSKNLTKAAFGVVTLVLLGTSMAAAQTPARDRLPPVTPKSAEKLNADELGKMLKDMGYDFKSVKLNNGVIVHQLDIPYSGKVVPLDISISPSGAKVWMSVWFNALPAGQTIPSHIMLQMLETNSKLGPCHFAMGNQKQLSLSCPLDNRNLSTEELRRWLDYYLMVYNQTENLWNTSKWGTQVGGGN
jgi:hypothetical protein